MKNYNNRPILRNFVINNKTMWFWDELHNLLCRCENGICEYVDLSCYKEIENGVSMYSSIVCVNGKLVLAPMNAKRILVYDIKKQEEEYIDIDMPEEFNKQNNRFMDIKALDDNKIFIIGYSIPCVIMFDLLNKNTQCLKFDSVVSGKVCLKYGEIYDRKLLVPSCIENKVYVIDVDTMEYSTKTFGQMEKGFSYIYNDGQLLWLLPRYNDKSIVKWNYYENKVEYFDSYCDFYENNLAGHGFICHDDTDYYVFPINNNCILKMNANQNGVVFSEDSMINNFELSKYKKNNKRAKYYFVGLYGIYIYGFMAETRSFIYFDPKSDFINEYIIELSEDTLEYWKNRVKTLKQYFGENKEFGLEDFLAEL